MKLKAFFLSLIAVLLAPAAFAGGTWSGVTVTQVQPCTSEGCAPNGTVLAILSASATGSPATCTSNHTIVAVDMTNAAGVFAASVLQTARMTGATITVTGTGSCNIYAGVETLSAIEE